MNSEVQNECQMLFWNNNIKKCRRTVGTITPLWRNNGFNITNTIKEFYE